VNEHRHPLVRLSEMLGAEVTAVFTLPIAGRAHNVYAVRLAGGRVIALGRDRQLTAPGHIEGVLRSAHVAAPAPIDTTVARRVRRTLVAALRTAERSVSRGPESVGGGDRLTRVRPNPTTANPPAASS
jgi:hypothetical protein